MSNLCRLNCKIVIRPDFFIRQSRNVLDDGGVLGVLGVLVTELGDEVGEAFFKRGVGGLVIDDGVAELDCLVENVKIDLLLDKQAIVEFE